MRIAYLILAHRLPEQLARLVDRLSTNGVTFFVHVDRNADIRAFKAALGRCDCDSLRWVEPRVHVNWGGYSVVEATLNGLRAIREKADPPDYVLLLSGQCYPIKTNDHIRQFLAANPGKVFIDHFPLPAECWGGLERIEKLWAMDTIGRVCRLKGARYWCGAIWRGLNMINAVLPDRRLPLAGDPHGGSQWWCIPWAAAEYALDQVRNSPGLSRFLRHTMCPDEWIFQTLILNSPFAGAVVNDSLRYLEWEEGSYHPRTLTVRDLPTLRASAKLFARKFDMHEDEAILDLVDHQLLGIADRRDRVQCDGVAGGENVATSSR